MDKEKLEIFFWIVLLVALMFSFSPNEGKWRYGTGIAWSILGVIIGLALFGEPWN